VADLNAIRREDRHFYDDIGARLRDGLSFRMGHLRDAGPLATRVFSGHRTPPEEQEIALRAAVEAGYYDPPREITLDEIAATLDIPRSTLSYRLRQAESTLLHRYIDDNAAIGWLE